MFNIRTDKSGNLTITASNAGREWIKYAISRDWGYWSIMSDILEPWEYIHFDAGMARPFVGLTSAPCIAESMEYDDTGEPAIVGRLWYFPDYAIRDDLAELKNLGRVSYQLATE